MNRNLAWNLRSERPLFIGAALVIALLVFVGFSKTYYLRAVFGSPPLSLFLHIHGLVMTAWVGILLAQVTLIAAHKVEWHRRLGAFGIAFAGLVVLLGAMATLGAAAREVGKHSPEAPMRLTVLCLELTQLVLFAGCVIAGFALRRRADYHKRFMLLATVCMLPNPLSRLPISFQSNLVILLMFDVLVAAVVIVDSIRGRKLHPVFGWGGAAVVIVLHAAFAFAYSSRWHQIGTWLVA